MENNMNLQEERPEQMISVRDALALTGSAVFVVTMLTCGVCKRHKKVIKKQEEMIAKLVAAGTAEFVRANTLKEVVDNCISKFDTINK